MGCEAGLRQRYRLQLGQAHRRRHRAARPLRPVGMPPALLPLGCLQHVPRIPRENRWLAISPLSLYPSVELARSSAARRRPPLRPPQIRCRRWPDRRRRRRQDPPMVRPWHRPRRPPPQRRGVRPHRRQAGPQPFPRPPNPRQSAPRQVPPKLWLRRRPGARSCPGYRVRPWPTPRRGRRRRGPRPDPRRRRAAARRGAAGAPLPPQERRSRRKHPCPAPPAAARSVSADCFRAAPGRHSCALPSATRRAIRGRRRARRRRTRRAPPGAARRPRGLAAKVGSVPPRPPPGSGRTR